MFGVSAIDAITFLTLFVGRIEKRNFLEVVACLLEGVASLLEGVACLLEGVACLPSPLRLL